MNNSYVKFAVAGGIAELVIWNPPVQALSANVRTGLWNQLDRAVEDNSVQAVLIRADGRTFPAGADIREFGKPPAEPSLPDLCGKIEDSPKIVVAALHGTVLGGGLELALSAHYRIADAGASMGFPEINLGILPGAGGTQRAPRIAGAAPSLELMLSGRPATAMRALGIGLIDRIAEGGLADSARAYTAELLAGGKGVRKTRERKEGIGDAAEFFAACAETEAKLAKKAQIPAARHIIDCVRKAADSTFETGMAFERECFLRCVSSPESKAMRHIFFAERTAAKPAGDPVKPRDIRSVAVIGGGTMGSGIAASCLQAGLETVLIETDDISLAAAEDRVRAVIGRAVSRGRTEKSAADAQLARFSGHAGMGREIAADLVIEAVFEDLNLKSQVLMNISERLRPGAVFATNTSYLDVNRLAETCGRNPDFLGLHFFAPAHVMRLVEVVPTLWTGRAAESTAFSLVKRLGKTGVRAGAQEGFIGNRMLAAYREAADLMLLDGATPFQIDAAWREFGFAMGIYETQDLSGLDISWSRRKRLAKSRDPDKRYCSLGDALCERGWFGQKSGRGYYLYDGGGRRENPAVHELLADARRASGSDAAKEFTAQKIQFQILAAMICEGARILEDGGAVRPSDIDVVKVSGYGFPRWKGGPMHYADFTGIDRVRDLVSRLQEAEPKLWSVPDLLRKMAEERILFDSINKGLYQIS